MAKRYKREYYFVLNSSHLLEEVFHGTTKQVCKFMQDKVTEKSIKSAVCTQKEFYVNGMYCVIVEDFEKNKRKREVPEEELWSLFDEGKKYLYYVSDKGRVKYKNKKTEEEKLMKSQVNERKEASIRANNKTRLVKNLVAKHFSPEYAEIERNGNRPYVRTKGKDPRNCALDNLEVYQSAKVTRKVKQRWRKCALYENGKKVKEYKSVKEAADDLYYDRSCICKYFNGAKYVKSLPFDLREI